LAFSNNNNEPEEGTMKGKIGMVMLVIVMVASAIGAGMAPDLVAYGQEVMIKAGNTPRYAHLQSIK